MKPKTKTLTQARLKELLIYDYESRITINGKLTILGYFDCPKEAHNAYCEAAIKNHGQFARLN